MEKERVLENVLNYLQHKDMITSEPFMKGDSEVPVSGGKLTYFDIVNLVDAALDGWITEGKWADRFRKSLCSYTGYHHAVLANSGSSANLLALSGVMEKYKSQYHGLVITSALAFPTTVAPILQTGLIPCFVDIEPNTLNPSAYSVEQAMKLRHPIVGVMMAHTMGIPFPIKEIDALCKEREIFLIQDTCDALGARTGRGERLSEYGDAATLSFFPAHHITSLDYSEPIMVRNKHKEIEILKIGDFVEKRFNKDSGWECVSFNKDGKLDFREITNVVSHPINEPLYKITVQTGRNSIVSKSHSVFMERDNEIIPVHVSSLSVGDLIFVPNCLPNPENCISICYTNYKRGSWDVYFEDIDVTEELGELLGYYIAEGSLCKTSRGNHNIQFSFGSDELDYAKAVSNDLEVMFDIKSRIYVKDSKCIVMASNKALYEFFLYECGNGAENKRIPSFMFSVAADVKKAFINAYFNGDGSEHYTYGSHKGYSKDSKTVSKWLSIDLHYLLLQLNINPRFSVESGSQRDFGQYISDCMDAYSICYSSKSIVDANGFRGEKANKKRKIGNLSLVKITKIEEIQSTSENVYDLSVRGYENFIGGIGMALHNTGEGGAVLTNDGRLFSAIRSYANWGRDCWCEPGEEDTCGKRFDMKFPDLPEHYDHKYVFSRIGYNMKMTELQAALGMAQMARIQNIIRDRRDHYKFLYNSLSNINGFDNLFGLIDYRELSSPFGFPIYTKQGKRNEIVSFLEKRKIKTRPVFSGNITHQPMLNPIPYDQVGSLSNCDRVMNDMFWIGCHPELNQDQLDYVVESFADFIGERL